MDITIKNFKPFESPDGGGFNCTVYVDGKRFCKAFDGGFGGCIEYIEMGKTTREELAEFWKTPDIDMKVYDAIQEFEIQKDIKRMRNNMKKEVMWILPNKDKGVYSRSALRENDQLELMKGYWRAKHKDAIFLDEGDNLERFLRGEDLFETAKQ